MEITFKGPAIVNLASSDLIEAFKHYASNDLIFEAMKSLKSKELTKIISEYLKTKKGMQVIKVQKYNNLEKVVAEVKYDQGARLIKEETPERAAPENYSVRFTGFYDAIKEIIAELRAKKKNSISFEDLYKEIIEFEDSKGVKMFVKNGVPIEKWRFKQYLTKSQLARYDSMRGIKRNSDGTGITF
jgi:hypothetical protein